VNEKVQSEASSNTTHVHDAGDLEITNTKWTKTKHRIHTKNKIKKKHESRLQKRHRNSTPPHHGY